MENGELTVAQVASQMEMSPSNASFQLKMLRERGLVVCRREKMSVFYRAEVNEAVDFAPELLPALRACFKQGIAPKTMIRHVTAFTHERRIEIFLALHGRSLSAAALRDVTGMSDSALLRHLDKLIRRGYVQRAGRVYRIGRAGNPLGRMLQKLAVR
jgi:DNA-binding transcriptional ArsR family regulator